MKELWRSHDHHLQHFQKSYIFPYPYNTETAIQIFPWSKMAFQHGWISTMDKTTSIFRFIHLIMG